MKLKTAKLKTMTVGELKACLDNFPDDKPVGYSYPSGDYWKSQLVGTIRNAEEGKVEYTEYHQQFQIQTDEDGEGQEILILN